NAVAIHLITPPHAAANGFGIGVQNNFVWIKSMAERWLIGARNTIAIKLSWNDASEIAMPDEIGLFGEGDPSGLIPRIGGIKQAEVYFSGVLGENGKVDSCSIPSSAKRVGIPRSNLHCWQFPYGQNFQGLRETS